MSTVTDTHHASGSRTPAKPAKAKREGAFFSGFSHLFLAAWALLVLYPLSWVVISAFKSDSAILKNPLSLIPDGLHFDNFSRAWTNGKFASLFFNTIVVLGGGVTLTMLLGSMAAYVLARYKFPGNRLIYYTFLVGLTVPIYVAAIPLFKLTDQVGKVFPPLGLNSHAMLILVYVGWSLSFTVFFMHSFFNTLPNSVAEAAMVDGASHTRLFFQVMLPMAKPGLVSIAIFNIIGQWNQWYLPVLLMNPADFAAEKHQVLAQGMLDLAVNQGYKSDWSGMFAGLTMAMVPVLVVYIAFQRQVQAGLTGGISK
ncbi:N-acetylglucosamine transport system permease protein [Allocatelliglobosispora scoriae]|uniref:N-acetylglucosamine transport system permease protein n=1 Tax=Allocatelliglobosispora scoriae TaxID=643052 RepID=A0A841BQG8_9ACTN|nr:carbohydrate ABC transporter permease [Allocatelliglobosispora scoriae]MBB5869183.1 N-acetylglucosamine transport system permease protein [Allocatelliglobosispora scoriae]